MSSQEIAVIETPEDAIAALRGEVLPEIEAPEVVARNIMERILQSESAEEILGGNAADHAQDWIGKPFELQNVRLLRSRFEDGPGVFAVLEGVDGQDGRDVAITCSARNVMTQAVQLWRIGALPRAVVIKQSDTPTASGYNVLWLEAA